MSALDLEFRNIAGVDRWVQDVFDDQIPFATSLAINWTALDFQRAQLGRMQSIFDINEPGFAKRAATIKPFATKQTQEARISVQAPMDRSDIFGKFETDDTKYPFSGDSIAVPTEHVPRTARGHVQKAWRPRRVLDRNFRDGFRAFVRPSRRKPGVRTIFFVEPGNGILPLYQLVPRVSLPPDLEFVETAEKTVQQKFDENFTRSFDQAIRTAR